MTTESNLGSLPAFSMAVREPTRRGSVSSKLTIFPPRTTLIFLLAGFRKARKERDGKLRKTENEHILVHAEKRIRLGHVGRPVQVVPVVLLVGIDEGEPELLTLASEHLFLQLWEDISTSALDDLDPIRQAGRLDVLASDLNAGGIVLDRDDMQLWVLTGQPDGGIAAEGTNLECVSYIEEAALKSHELGLCGRGRDVGQSVGLGCDENVLENLGIGAGGRVRVTEGVGIDGGPDVVSDRTSVVELEIAARHGELCECNWR